MSLARLAVRGVAWTMAFNTAGRALGLLGTLVLTRYLSPDAIGEVQVAVVLVTTANFFSLLGIGHYIVAKPNEDASAVFHSTVINLASGAVAIGAVAVWGGPLAIWFDTPVAAAYVPWLAVSVALDRVAFVPTRVLMRDMRFRDVGLARTLGELLFPVVAVGLALQGYGGWALVAANLVRSAARTAGTLLAAGFRSWLTPCRLTLARMRAIFGFGLPNGVANMAGFAARHWDNLLMARMFGPAELGIYQLAYNLSDIPSNQVGEHVGDVLLPSFARLHPTHRRAALARALRLLALIMFPLSIGLGVMAPTLVAALLSPTWAEVAPRVTILAALSAAYPIGFAIHSYLNASDHPRWVMVLGVARTALLLGFMALLGMTGGPLWACAGVGIAFGAYSALGMMVVARIEKSSPWFFLQGLWRPLAACLPMTLVILGVRAGLTSLSVGSIALYVVCEFAAGAIAFVAAAWVVAPGASRDLVSVVTDTWLRRQTSGKDGHDKTQPQAAR